MDHDILSDAAAQRHLEEIFQWDDLDTATCWLFLSGRLNQRIATDPLFIPELVTVDITENQRNHVANNGTEEWKIDRLDKAHRDAPILIAVMPNGMATIIDGNHRILRRWRDGLRDAQGYLLPFDMWHPLYGWRL